MRLKAPTLSEVVLVFIWGERRIKESALLVERRGGHGLQWGGGVNLPRSERSGEGGVFLRGLLSGPEKKKGFVCFCGEGEKGGETPPG